MSYLVIVESPTKAKTISRFLPKEFMLEATIGHIRNLPQSAKEVPAEYRATKWGRLGIDIENNFSPLYIIEKGKKEVVKKLKEKLSKVEAVYLATDEDREGESICWHIKEVLKPKIPVYRMVFHEITKEAISKALQECRDINMDLVRAQETRRILDRLFGFALSPLIWKKIAYGLSAGRVQSPALRILVEREFDIIAFQRNQYWDIIATLSTSDHELNSRMIAHQGKQLAQSKHFDPHTGKYKGTDNVILLQEKQAKQIMQKLQTETWEIVSIEEKPTQHRPPFPFITSTLQQAANNVFRWSAKNTMRIAQSLYEKGFITYMRTDSVNLSEEAITAAREAAASLYGSQYVADIARRYHTKSKLAQEAHEAIRPSGTSFTSPESLQLKPDEKKLYTLIYQRTLATQMKDAQKKTLSIKLRAGESLFASHYTIVIFAGFLLATGLKQEDTSFAKLSTLKEKTLLSLQSIQIEQHETRPPSRYTEAALIKKLEEIGIGRPSTYANIISTLLERKYIFKKGLSLIPTYTGIAVTNLLKDNFDTLVKYEFTSDMEANLDSIAIGKQEYIQYLQKFYLGEKGLRSLIEYGNQHIDNQQYRKLILPHIEKEIRISQYGAYFIAKDDTKVNISNETSPAELSNEAITELLSQVRKKPQQIGKDPHTGKLIYCRTGMYGHYLQLGEDNDNPKPKRVRLNTDPTALTLEEAIKLLSLPRKLGQHPQTGKPVIATIGPYGPYVGCEKEYRSAKDDDIYTITLQRALELLSQPKTARRRKSQTPTSRKRNMAKK